jgi:hypothetical protein
MILDVLLLKIFRFLKYNQLSNFLKIISVGANLYHEVTGMYRDGRTDLTNKIVAFRNYVNEPTNK